MVNELVIHVGRGKEGFVEARLATTRSEVHYSIEGESITVERLVVHVIEIARFRTRRALAVAARDGFCCSV
jgi:hypothetical protein